MEGDSGTTNHYIAPTDLPHLQNLQPNCSVNVLLPNGTELTSTETGTLPFKNLSQDATKAYVLPGLSNTLLLSFSQLDDDGCIILLTKNHLKGLKNLKES